MARKITDERFTKMTANYQKEQKELLKLVADGKKKLLDAEQTKVDLRLLMKTLRDYTDLYGHTAAYAGDCQCADPAHRGSQQG